jgi:7,8-dihydropterin-6-yl-methyl-4-(beta-D-ribofuranosyl)aminobenzene 5'-phosphate synthase
MAIKITTLSENTALSRGILAEWGLSILVEVDDTTILFDCGQSSSVVRNASALGIDLSKVDGIVLSHGHYDHTGGLRDVLRVMRKEVQIIAHPDIWQSKYVRRTGEKSHRYIGIPFQREELEDLGASFHLSRKPVWISEKLVTTGEIEMSSGPEQVDSGLFIREGKAFVPDPLRDDLAMGIRTDDGLFVLTGCAHRGIVNTIYTAQKIMDTENCSTVIGGTHLLHASEKQLAFTIDELKKMKVQKIGVSHCTGFHAEASFSRKFGKRFFLNNAGTKVKLPWKTILSGPV